MRRFLPVPSVCTHKFETTDGFVGRREEIQMKLVQKSDEGQELS